MKCIYIPGLKTTYTELDQIEQMFLKEGPKINFLFENYSLLSTFRKNEILFSLYCRQ